MEIDHEKARRPLIVVGLFMLAPITRIDFADYTESIPAFAVVTLMCFSFNIAMGITEGFVLYPICKLARRQDFSDQAGFVDSDRAIAVVLYFLSARSLSFWLDKKTIGCKNFDS